MGIPDLDLERTFFCHSHLPEYGFWGELRTMVREDMTIGDAIKFIKRKWGFSYSLKSSIEHEITHLMAEIATIYYDNLSFFAPSVDPQTGMLKAQAHNGFDRAEEYIEMLQLSLFWDETVQPIENFIESRSPFNKIGNYHRDELIALHIVNNSPTLTCIFTEKTKRGFEGFESAVLDEIDAVGFPKSKTSIFGEQLKPVHADEEFKRNAKALHSALRAGAQYFQETVFHPTYPSQVTFVEPSDISIRDLHILIGGEEAAHAYFAQCGVPEYKKAAGLTATP